MVRLGCIVSFIAGGVVGVCLAGPATGPTTSSATTRTVSIVELRKVAEGQDVSEGMAALRQLALAGDGPGVRLAVQLILARDSVRLGHDCPPVAAALAKVQASEKELVTLRATALDEIAKLTKTPEAQKSARSNYDRLAALLARTAAEYPRQLKLADVIARRKECLVLWRAADKSAPPEDSQTVSAETARLTKMVEQAIGVSALGAAELAGGPLEPPADATLVHLWLYVSSRRIEAYNKTIEPSMNAAEVAHARRLNGYREMLGLLPYEYDLRLIQSARRHSKEMFDLKYFSHWSPTVGQQSCFERTARAGYPRGSSENITLGGWTGDEAFWLLFRSPAHHRDWVQGWETALGVGKWENAWTENMGAGKRLMLMPEAQRAKIAIVGEELPPQKMELTRKSPREISEYKFYDQMGNESSVTKFQPGPGGQK